MYEGPEFLEEQGLTLSDEPSSVLSSDNTVQVLRSKLQEVPAFERVAIGSDRSHRSTEHVL